MKRTTTELQLDDVGFTVQLEPCPECGAEPGDDHATWCLHDQVEEQADDELADEA